MHLIREALVRRKCARVLIQARNTYSHLDLSKVEISFNLKGIAAGMADRVSDVYRIRFNADLLHRSDKEFRHLLEDTIPHEVAHIVCFMEEDNTEHNDEWRELCVTLGGSGTAKHDILMVYGTGATFEYTTTKLIPVRVTETRHTRIQHGEVFNYGDLGLISCDCKTSMVGLRGRTLPVPVFLN
jgi:predicted SprT family Zn-dependent metalloprotease